MILDSNPFAAEPEPAKLDPASIPGEIAAILSTVREYAPEAVIAGGYLRDLTLGVPHVDLDIVVRAREHGDALGLESDLEHFAGFELEDSCDLTEEKLEAYRKHFGGDLVGVSTFRVGDEKVQVVALDAFESLEGDDFAERVLDRIDFGACRIAFDGERVIERPEARHDFVHGTFTLYRARDGAAVLNSVARFMRWRVRYPRATFEIAVPIEASSEPLEVTRW